MPWPTTCAVCRGWSLQRICAECRDAHARPVSRCDGCALKLPPGWPTPDPSGASPAAGSGTGSGTEMDAVVPPARCGRCLQQRFSFDRSIAAVDYGYPWRPLIAAMKYRDGLDLVPALADALSQAVAARADMLPSRVLPVPLSPARLQARGYNQAWELCRRVAARAGVEARHDLLQRLVDAPTQAGLDRAARLRNLRGAFHVPPRAASMLRGAHVALVDDVMTTGATLSEAANALRRAGAARIDAWVVARTDER